VPVREIDDILKRVLMFFDDYPLELGKKSPTSKIYNVRKTSEDA
jgi:hypothetical protein